MLYIIITKYSSNIKHPSQNNYLQVHGINAQCCNINHRAQIAFSLQPAPTLETTSKITITILSQLNQESNAS